MADEAARLQASDEKQDAEKPSTVRGVGVGLSRYPLLAFGLYLLLFIPLALGYSLPDRLWFLIGLVTYPIGGLILSFCLLDWWQAKRVRGSSLLRLPKNRRFIAWALYALPLIPIITFHVRANEPLTWPAVYEWGSNILFDHSRWIGSLSLLIFYLLGATFYELYWNRVRIDQTQFRESNFAIRFLRKLRKPTSERFFIALIFYLAPISLIAIIYWWADKLAPSQFFDFLSQHHRLGVIMGLLIVYFLGGLMRDLLRYGFRIFATPIYCAACLLLLLVLVIAFPESHDRVGALLDILKANLWLLVLFGVAVILGPQIKSLVPRMQKAELPGGVKFELDKLDEMQENLVPWKKTVTRFAELMDWVSRLIEETPQDEIVHFLAYTPALGFLTRTENEWLRLQTLLLRRSNIQITCLNQEDLKKWHEKFLDKRTARPEGRITERLIKRANKVSQMILSEKRKHRNVRARLVEKKWDELPGYYLFANSKRAIIVAPLFLPGDPDKPATVPGPENNLENAPVKMLGFESTDNWTVWHVREVCNQYLPKRNADATPLFSEPPRPGTV